MSNQYPAQFNLILLTAFVSTFPFFDAKFNIVYVTSAVFPFRVPSPPDGKVVVYIG